MSAIPHVLSTSSSVPMMQVVPTCSCCRRERDDQGSWHVPREARTQEVLVSHTLCVECARTLYPEIADSL